MLSPTPGLERLLARRPLGDIELGLARIRALLARVGDPHRSFRSVHVGGTNGKGSTAAMIEAVLRADGHRTGLYTSPELLELPERFRVDGEPLPAERLESWAAELAPLVAETGATFFEAGTALAFHAFRACRVEVAVVEVGMGGRHDATNVLRPEVCAVPSVALDHVEWLGSELGRVATEKAGILEEGVPAALGPLDPEVRSVFEREAAEVGAPLFVLGRDARVEEVEVEPTGTTFRYEAPGRGPIRLAVPLPGAHQARNAGVAVLALDRLPDPPADPVLERGLASVRWRGRGEWIEVAEGGGWLLDTAHNPAAAAALVELIRATSPPRPIVLLASVLRDKAWEEILDRLLPACGGAVLTVAPSSAPERRWDPAAAARGRGPTCVVELDFGTAMGRARELAETGTVLVAGSTAVVGDVLRRLTGRRSRDGAAAPRASLEH